MPVQCQVVTRSKNSNHTDKGTCEGNATIFKLPNKICVIIPYHLCQKAEEDYRSRTKAESNTYNIIYLNILEKKTQDIITIADCDLMFIIYNDENKASSLEIDHDFTSTPFIPITRVKDKLRLYYYGCRRGRMQNHASNESSYLKEDLESEVLENNLTYKNPDGLRVEVPTIKSDCYKGSSGGYCALAKDEHENTHRGKSYPVGIIEGGLHIKDESELLEAGVTTSLIILHYLFKYLRTNNFGLEENVPISASSDRNSDRNNQVFSDYAGRGICIKYNADFYILIHLDKKENGIVTILLENNISKVYNCEKLNCLSTDFLLYIALETSAEERRLLKIYDFDSFKLLRIYPEKSVRIMKDGLFYTRDEKSSCIFRILEKKDATNEEDVKYIDGLVLTEEDNYCVVLSAPTLLLILQQSDRELLIKKK